ncbi:hypothetical protein AKJ08_1062 [Vulgatibacter incomptus]|uniref:Uncharacterized protein n=1 Tax=Vulgatibacter incomptus TaxID=1391653 RepID=A0A0K1PAX4_9BACT|nr:hypothetical protein AKJ08_1062 [Vulgatibacter incomptus]
MRPERVKRSFGRMQGIGSAALDRIRLHLHTWIGRPWRSSSQS